MASFTEHAPFCDGNHNARQACNRVLAPAGPPAPTAARRDTAPGSPATEPSTRLVRDAAFPGAIAVANLLRSLGWLIVVGYAVLGSVVGGLAADTGRSSLVLLGALIGGAVGAAMGAIGAAMTFAVAYVLLLLSAIERNTR